jgi:hypothetical protein
MKWLRQAQLASKMALASEGKRIMAEADLTSSNREFFSAQSPIEALDPEGSVLIALTVTFKSSSKAPQR